MSLTAFIFSFSVHAMDAQEFRASLQKIYSDDAPKEQQCDEHYKNVVNQAFKPVEQDSVKDEFFVFTEDETKAIGYMNAFDANKILAPSDFEANKLYFDNCNKETTEIFNELNKNRTQCFAPAYELGFLRALIYATKNYNWKPETKKQARDLVVNFLKKSVETTQPPLRNQVNGAVLVTLIEYGLAPVKLKKEAKKLYLDADLMREKILKKSKAEYNKLSSEDKLSCIPLVNYRRNEIAQNEIITKRFQKILKKIN